MSSSGLSWALGISCALFGGGALLTSNLVPAQDNAAAKNEVAEQEQANEGPQGNPYAAPAGSSVAELEKFVERMLQKPESIRKRQEFQDAIADAAERILKVEASDQQRVAAVKALFDALHQQAVLGDTKADGRLMDWAKKLSEDPQGKIASAAKLHVLEARLMEARAGKPELEQVQSLFEDVKALLTKEPATKRHLRLVSETIGLVNSVKDAKLKDEMFDQLGEFLVKSEDREVARYGKQILKKPDAPAAPKPSELIGKTLELEGNTTDGLPFDWASYRGKVVLVDFWATWCGPCRAELPNLKANYEKYHDQGFEVVAISLDNDRDTLLEFLKEENIPWVNLFDEINQGWGNPLAKKYNVRAIPTALLVDKDGKVISTNARGEALTKKLDELFAK